MSFVLTSTNVQANERIFVLTYLFRTSMSFMVMAIRGDTLNSGYFAS